MSLHLAGTFYSSCKCDFYTFDWPWYNTLCQCDFGGGGGDIVLCVKRIWNTHQQKEGEGEREGRG